MYLKHFLTTLYHFLIDNSKPGPDQGLHSQCSVYNKFGMSCHEALVNI